MKNKVEPTVEKWERELSNIIFEDTDLGIVEADLIKSRLEKLIRTLLSHSVQETKVEPTVEKWEPGAVGKNVHSVYTHCRNCWMWGINMPLDKVCGNCGKTTDIETYYDSETITKLLDESVQEAKAERVAEIENSKIISSIGYRPSKFRGLSAVAIYNMALDDLLASLKQEEEKV